MDAYSDTSSADTNRSETLYKSALSALQTLCSKREYCIKDIRTKALQRLEGDAEAAQRAIDSLIEEGFLDELRYASAFARDKSSINGWGIHKIRQQLLAKGISQSTTALALEEIDEDKAYNKLLKLLEIKRKSLEGEPYHRLKLIRFALSKGYDYEVVDRAIREL